jgi:glycosyltransferase involved in cell wall biosynthesis
MLLVIVGDLTGSGGTERYFADLFEYLRRDGSRPVELVTSTAALERLREAGRVTSAEQVLPLPLGSQPARSRAGILKLTAMLLWATLRRRWDVVHICQPTPIYVPYAALLALVPRAWRPRVAITVVDCTLAHHLQSGTAPTDRYEQQVVDAHRWYFRWAAIDGIYSWYRAFVDAARALHLVPGATLASTPYCFTDTTRFTPGDKQRLMVFAGRLSNQKRPLLFVDAVASLLRRHGALTEGWHFAMYGGGPLESDVVARIRALGLEQRLSLARTPDMAPVFARSKLFVSTQAFENFTSLAMLEAMAAGNAIVAENAGQTADFVKDHENGVLVAEATPDAFADAIASYLRQPERHTAMAAASRRLATEVHTVRNCADHITAFWQQLVSG